METKKTIQRTPTTSRWAPSNAELIRGVPWNTRDDDDTADGDKLEVIKLSPADAEAANQPREHFGNIPVPRRVKISKNDLIMHGYTAKCDGCRAAMAGRPQKPHGEEFRQRMEKLMKQNPKMQKAHKRMNDFLDKVGDEQDRRDDEGRDKRSRAEEADHQLALPGAGQQRELPPPPD